MNFGTIISHYKVIMMSNHLEHIREKNASRLLYIKLKFREELVVYISIKRLQRLL